MVYLQLGLAAASTFAAGSSQRRAYKKQKRDLAFQKQQLRADTADAASLALEGGKAAAAPLEREADLLRTGAGVRNQILEDALTTAVRGQAEAATQREAGVAGGINPGRLRQGVLGQLFQGQALLAKESQRGERFRQNAALRGQLLAQAGELTASGFKSAASIRAQGGMALAGMPSGVSKGPSALAGGLAALNEAYGSMSSEEQDGISAKISEFFGGSEDPLTQTALTTTQFNELSAANKLPEGRIKVAPDQLASDLLGQIRGAFQFDIPQAKPQRLNPPFAL